VFNEHGAASRDHPVDDGHRGQVARAVAPRRVARASGTRMVDPTRSIVALNTAVVNRADASRS
jgi:hypothetical protein